MVVDYASRFPWSERLDFVIICFACIYSYLLALYNEMVTLVSSKCQQQGILTFPLRFASERLAKREHSIATASCITLCIYVSWEHHDGYWVGNCNVTLCSSRCGVKYNLWYKKHESENKFSYHAFMLTEIRHEAICSRTMINMNLSELCAYANHSAECGYVQSPRLLIQ